MTLCIKNPSAMQETQEMRVQSLAPEGPLEEGMAIHSSIFTWRIPWTKEPGGLLSIGSDMTEVTEHTHTHIGFLSQGHEICSQPLQLS